MNRPSMLKQKGSSVRYSDFSLERANIIHLTIDERVEMIAPTTPNCYSKSKSSFAWRSDAVLLSPSSGGPTSKGKLTKKRDELDNSNHDRNRKPLSAAPSSPTSSCCGEDDLDTSHHQRRDRRLVCSNEYI